MIWAKSWEDCPEYVGLEDRDGVCRWIKRPEWPGAYILHPTSRSGEYGFRVRGCLDLPTRSYPDLMVLSGSGRRKSDEDTYSSSLEVG